MRNHKAYDEEEKALPSNTWGKGKSLTWYALQGENKRDKVL